MASLTFFKLDRVIQVDAPENEVTIQDLVNQIRDYEDELDFMDYDKIANAYGKQPLGGGSFVGITLELVNDWRLQFEARTGPAYEIMTVSGGNLVAINSYDNNPIKPSAFTQVVIAQSSSPTIITPPEDVNMLYLIESLRGNHASLGNVWYWDPINGSDTNDGTQPGEAVATFAQAQTLATDGNHDVIFALAKDTDGVTTTTETINITKDNLKLRGPGYAFQIVPSASGTDTVTINANGVEVSGFYIETAGGGTDNGITVTGNNNLIKDCWVNGVTGDGISISTATRTTIEKCAIENATGNGISLGSTTTNSKVSTNIITGSTIDGIDISGGATSTDNILEGNIIYNNTGNSIEIGTGVLRTGIRLHHTIANNGVDSITDAGTDTFQDTSGTITSGDIDSIVDGVWDEVISGHLTAGTTGRTLKDAKTKATLASLK